MNYQNEIEFKKLLDVYILKNPQRVVEIGSLLGETLYYWTAYGMRNKIVSIDMLVSQQDSRYQQQKAGHDSLWATHASTFKNDFLMIEGSSHDPANVEKVRNYLGNIDFLFIDGDHTYEGVKRDFDLYAPLVAPGGIIALHDIAHSSAEHIRVDMLWNEIKGNYKFEEFLHDTGQYGIGVLYV